MITIQILLMIPSRHFFMRCLRRYFFVIWNLVSILLMLDSSEKEEDYFDTIETYYGFNPSYVGFFGKRPYYLKYSNNGYYKVIFRH
ncbi:MAG TPA: hypothetical protein P5107_09395, partial [Thermotogota bacterium]|nr:hypothetical protein [Thermotogota bacterium]